MSEPRQSSDEETTRAGDNVDDSESLGGALGDALEGQAKERYERVKRALGAFSRSNRDNSPEFFPSTRAPIRVEAAIQGRVFPGQVSNAPGVMTLSEIQDKDVPSDRVTDTGSGSASSGDESVDRRGREASPGRRTRARPTGTTRERSTRKSRRTVGPARGKNRKKSSRTQDAIAKENKRLKEGRDNAEMEFELQQKLADVEQGSAEIDRMLTTVEKAEEVERAEARKRTEKRLEELRREQIRVEEELEEKLRQERIHQLNKQIRERERDWLTPVAGMLGMESDLDLLATDETGLYSLSPHISAAKTSALKQVGELVGIKKATFEELRAEHTFLTLISLYYLKFDTFRTFRMGTKRQLGVNLNYDIEKQLFNLLKSKYKMSVGEISAKLLGRLNDCGGGRIGICTDC